MRVVHLGLYAVLPGKLLDDCHNMLLGNSLVVVHSRVGGTLMLCIAHLAGLPSMGKQSRVGSGVLDQWTTAGVGWSFTQ
jgi:hypothetical protein